MNSSSVKKQLYSVYEEYIPKLIETVKSSGGFNRKLSYPLLIEPFDDYFNQSKRIMFFGKETFDWIFDKNDYYFNDKHDNQTLIKQLLDNYRNFQFADNHIRKKSPFWVFCHDTFKRLTGNSSKNGFIWNNISKLDENRKTPTDDFKLLAASCYPILNKELEILKPDVVIFITGTSSDEFLVKLFPGIEYKVIQKGYFSQLIHKELPEHTYRTYHPRFLRMTGKTNEIQELLAKHII